MSHNHVERAPLKVQCSVLCDWYCRPNCARWREQCRAKDEHMWKQQVLVSVLSGWTCVRRFYACDLALAWFSD